MTDNGLGMTEEEVDEYINQIAFSGAQDFLNKYKDKANEDQIIGHFGLGFYSAFMVADQRNHRHPFLPRGCDSPFTGSPRAAREYEMTDGDKDTVGTHDHPVLKRRQHRVLQPEYRAREVIEKYCAFMPVEIYLQTTRRRSRSMRPSKRTS